MRRKGYPVFKHGLTWEVGNSLQKQSNEVRSSWNIVHPSYIIGAVRDILLSHMVGFSTYAALQTKMELPIAFQETSSPDTESFVKVLAISTPT